MRTAGYSLFISACGRPVSNRLSVAPMATGTRTDPQTVHLDFLDARVGGHSSREIVGFVRGVRAKDRCPRRFSDAEIFVDGDFGRPFTYCTGVLVVSFERTRYHVLAYSEFLADRGAQARHEGLAGAVCPMRWCCCLSCELCGGATAPESESA